MCKKSEKVLFFVALCVIALAGYGYVFTHGTCGIDDISIDLYFEKGIGAAIGRWPYYLINKVLPIAEYTPFIGDFITVLLLLLSVVIWCALLHSLIPEKLSVWAYIVFAAMFMNYSMNADVFVFYLQNGLGWVHLFSVLSLAAFLYLYKRAPKVKKQIALRIATALMLTLAISFYESAANLFLSGVFLIMLIDLFVQKEMSCFRGRKFIGALFFTARYLLYAMAARRIIRALIMRIFSIPAYTFYRSAASIEWIKKGDIKKFLAQIFCDYFAASAVYYPIFLFLLCSVVFAVLLLYFTWRRKDWLFGLTGIGLYLSLFSLCVIQGASMEYRACQVFTVFVAFLFFLITGFLSGGKKQVKLCGGVIIACAVLYSTYDLNRWFMLDYEKTEYELGVIDEIAAELNSGKYNIEEKPLVIVGEFKLPDEIYDRYCVKDTDYGWNVVKYAAEAAGREIDDKYAYGQNDRSMIDWSVHAFAMHCGYNVPIRQFFEYRGHKFLWADAETAKRVFQTYYPLDWEYYSYTYIENYTENYNGAAEYPQEGYIEETADCIIVRL